MWKLHLFVEFAGVTQICVAKLIHHPVKGGNDSGVL